MNLRDLARRVLDRAAAGDAYINLAIGRACETLSDRDRRYLTALVYGTVERRITLDYAIGSLARRSDISPGAKSLLEPALYELFYLRTPAHAAVNAWVSLAGSAGEKSFVNGVLRAAARLGEPPLPPREKNLLRYLSVRYSVPLDTVRLLSSVLGEEIEDFLAMLDAPARMTLRVNTTKITREAYLARLLSVGIPAEPTPNAPFGIRLAKTYPPKELPGFDEGLFFVQDEASQIAVSVLSPLSGETVVDLCACPGGKSFGAAMTMEDRGEVLSFDLHASKLSLIESGAARLGLTCIRAAEQDGTVPRPDLLARADRVLCDVPCSGLGVLAKKADLRYRDLSACAELPPLQAKLLDTAASYVKSGGTLLYSTCTIRPEENQAITDAFLPSHPDFVPEDFSCGALSSQGGRLTLLPHRDGTDGFYLAKFRRKG